MDTQPILGLRTAIYRGSDLDRAKEWYRAVLGIDPYFDQPFYVGFNVGGFELGLYPDTSEGGPGRGGVTIYWGVGDGGARPARLLGLGGREHSPGREVGEGIKVAAVLDPFGNVFGIIENPHFKLEGPALPHPPLP